ncbi:hypothetical protein RJ641_009433 [Dillenia turbinata]|uniref:Uncharacterized protein n=1 Tax=Dillenia turbinata TaxID=194707 RepID=A0AAN8VCY1_9MAGN
MDLWVVAAAAGAGYLAKFCKNLSRDKERLSGSGGSNFAKFKSPPTTQQLLDLIPNDLGDGVPSQLKGVSNGKSYPVDGAWPKEVERTSHTGGEDMVSSDNLEECRFLSISGLPPRLSENGSDENNEGNIQLAGGIDNFSGDLLPETAIAEVGSFHSSMPKRRSLRARWSYRQVFKPVSSLDSCIVAQLYRENAEVDDCVLGPLPAPCTPTVKPLIVTDGRQVISRGGRDSFCTHFGYGENKVQKEATGKEDETIIGVPPLPQIRSSKSTKKMNLKKGRAEVGKLNSGSKVFAGNEFHWQGSSQEMISFCFGVSVGVISAMLTAKKEVEKVKELLKQTENLVQDLQDELEMKDSLTVKELASEDCESQHTHEHNYLKSESFENSTEKDFIDELCSCHGKETNIKKSEDGLIHMSQIEAELEAELERLELNMKVPSFNKRSSNLVELDSDIVGDLVCGELRTDMVNGRAIAPDSDRDSSGTSTVHTANYAVSPRELSLRLHEVIQSRLEERIEELETALQNSRKKLQHMESEGVTFRRLSPDYEWRSPSPQESFAETGRSSMAEPMVIKLTGEALTAYNECYDELMRMDESEEESTAAIREDADQEGLYAFKHTFMQYESLLSSHLENFAAPQELSTIKEHIWDSSDTVNSDDDEVAKLLKKRIVEKTREGSPTAILKAQKVLYSLEEHQHSN